MKVKNYGLALFLFLLQILMMNAQEKNITGTVTIADDGLPLPGASIIIKGTSRGVQTDFDGKYSIQAAAGEVLVFSYVNMKTAEVTIGSSSVYNMALEYDNALKEIVVVGYATTTKARSNVSTVKISSSTIENRPNASFIQTLSGQVPGLNVTTSSGQPGGNSLVQLRGVASINGNTEPLFIIDGAPVNADNFRAINPQEIASIDVLKDAGATAIYGNRGANGVVIIKTKRGSYDQGLQVNYNGFVAYSQLPTNDYNLMNSQELLTYERSRSRGVGGGNPGGVNKAFPSNGAPLTDAEIAATPTTDWLDIFFKTAVTQSHNVNLSSGGENSNQFTSFGYNETEGILVQSGLQRFNLRNNVSGKSKNNKFNYDTNISMNYTNTQEPNTIGSATVNRNFVIGGTSSLPYNTVSQFTPEIIESVISGPAVIDTPWFLLDRLDTYARDEEDIKLIASATFGYQILPWLKANVVIGADYENLILTRAQFPESINSRIFGGDNEFQDQQTTRRFTYNQVTSLNMDRSFGKHNINLGLYTEYFKGHFKAFGFRANGLDPATFALGDGSGFISDNTDGDVFVDTINANILNSGLFSYFTSFDYDYDTKYGFGATVRRDASYRFSDSNRWATFWSVSGRWNISNEDFMKGSVFDNLKLRASYGTAGNQDISGGGPFSSPDLTKDLFQTGPGYINQNSISLLQLGNRELKWETIETYNIGLDFGAFNSRLRGTVDYYNRRTSDLFQEIPVSAVTGFTELNANVGKLENRGWDFSVSYDIARARAEGDLNISVGVIGNYNVNEIIELAGGEQEQIGLGRVGGPLNEIFTLRYAGVNPANGELLFLDANGNITENPDPDNDRVWLGKNAIPDWNGGLNLSIDYKNFFLTTQWNYAIGVDRYDLDLSGFYNPDNVGQFNLSKDILNSWQQPGDITDIPSDTASNRNTYAGTASDRFLRSANFLRLRFASFGYNFPAKYLENSPLSKLRLFISAENLITFSPWRGFDPEVFNTDGEVTRNVNQNEFPTPGTVLFGLELSF